MIMKLPNGYGSVVKLSGKRRKPYIVRKTVGFHYDEKKDKQVQDYIIIGYAKTKAEGLKILSDYNGNPYDITLSKMTFSEVYNEWSKRKFETISKSNITGYKTAYKSCTNLYNRLFKEIKAIDLQNIIDNSGKNYPTLRKLKVLFNQMYEYAMKNEICNKDYSDYVDITQYKDRNPNKYDRNKFTRQEIAKIWENQNNQYCQIILMLLYNGARISEFLDLKKDDVFLDEQYFIINKSKTESGIRKVPIANKVLKFYEYWYNKNPSSEYFLHNPDGNKFTYRNYYDAYFIPIMEELNMNHTPHCCRHTCISMLAEAGVDQTAIKKIVGHSGAMTLTEKVYTHFDMKILLDAINKI